jgi:probable rRNA maturation factor
MKLNLEIMNIAKTRLDEKLARAAVLGVLRKAGLSFLSSKNVSMSLAVINKKEIKKLNRMYRKKDETTDILSFSEHKSAADLKKIKSRDIFLGELVVCLEDIQEYARKNKLDFKKELATVLAHGTLHLLGFKHGEKMFKIQNNLFH